MGAGADIVASCTFRIGTPAARFRFPGFRFGVALGTRHLAQLVGTQKARELLLSNATIDAGAALRLGLLTHLVESESLQSAADELLASAAGLDRNSRSRILHLTSAQDDDANLAELVRSVSAPGLHERIARYRAAH
jgi:enoyl-CoA hydratase/carnithine racemase